MSDPNKDIFQKSIETPTTAPPRNWIDKVVTSTPSASYLTSKKGRKSRGASVAPSPLSVAVDFSAPSGSNNPGSASGAAGVQWATPGTPGGGAKHDDANPYYGVVGTSTHRQVPRAGAPRVADEDADEDDVLPDMADDDYSAQQSFQSQSTANLK